MKMKKFLGVVMTAILAISMLTGCGGAGDSQVVIYSNADEEAIAAMQNALDSNGYEAVSYTHLSAG